ncbi:DDE-type integrase/transposase/recombinase [Streptomyces akebiae]|uniref:DDE-type integrase/transposase/recombinase n=1 Tax=Streptomyces akebiae TaxID=2865673 RepID=A0ABX8XSM2_9ACTN|nr:DDE-type integrase/transposase/recombinase [Streptomyces akebiae]QYX78911.1 DDE-type integrase/transposase/recombinase [Streptomyces akebiae]
MSTGSSWYEHVTGHASMKWPRTAAKHRGGHRGIARCRAPGTRHQAARAPRLAHRRHGWLDLATREVVGYAMADHHRAELVVDALDMAHGRGHLQPGCVIHSDRGREYTSAQFRDRIRELGLRQSCGRTGSCFDNAAAESFWALLKEEIGTRTWPERATARAEVFNFIETFYNRRRLRKHKIFGYLTPAETRQRQQHALAA